MGTDLERNLRSLLHRSADVDPPERLVRLIGAIPSRHKTHPGHSRVMHAAVAGLAATALLVVAVGVVGPRLLPGPAALTDASQVASRSGVSPTGSSANSVTTGCGITAASIVPEDSEPPLVAYGPAAKPPLTGLSVAVTDPRAAFIHPLAPSTSPAGLQLQASLLAPWTATGATADTRLLLVYSRDSVGGLNIDDIVAGGGWIVTEAPAGGQTAAAIESVLDGMGASAHYASVLVGPNQAVLVHGSAAAGATRPYTLSWSDGTRDISVLATSAANQIIDFARSLYCS